MNKTKGLRCLFKVDGITVKKYRHDILDPSKPCIPHSIQSPRFLGNGGICSQESLITGRNLFRKFDLARSFRGNSPFPKQSGVTYCGYGSIAKNEPDLSRNFLAQLWAAERKIRQDIEKRRKRVNHSESVAAQESAQHLFETFFSGGKTTEESYTDRAEPVFKQPPVSQSVSGSLKPTSPEEAKIAPLLARSNLLITRDIEWANLVFGFEQENRYAIVDVSYPQSPVGFIREQSNFIARQLLRSRRPFVADITDAMGKELFRVRRPFWFINSSIYTEIDGKVIGVVHRRWHLWKRVYDLYLGNVQFAVVENPGFWNWTFNLKDINGQVLAQIDRNWRGFGFEIFTDAGQYVIRFGSADPVSKTGPASLIEELNVDRPLTLSERAVTAALAISLDNDYFSRHGGWGIPFVAVGE